MKPKPETTNGELSFLGFYLYEDSGPWWLIVSRDNPARVLSSGGWGVEVLELPSVAGPSQQLRMVAQGGREIFSFKHRESELCKAFVVWALNSIEMIVCCVAHALPGVQMFGL